MKIIFIMYLNLIDYLCTTYHVTRYGTQLEVNPLMRCLMVNDLSFLAVKVILVDILLVFLYCHRELKVVQVGTWVLLIVYGILALYHLFLLLI